MVVLTLIRHGQSTYNLENRFTGNTDVALTSFGKEEATLFGHQMEKA
ncbi:histidine phosphatase family protein [Flavobacterium sp. ZT3R18]|nr:histidine phosphatase family protein [Flavobacterium sp. ZT3R18]